MYPSKIQNGNVNTFCYTEKIIFKTDIILLWQGTAELSVLRTMRCPNHRVSGVWTGELVKHNYFICMQQMAVANLWWVHSVQGKITVIPLWSNSAWPIYWRGLHWPQCLHNLMTHISRQNNFNVWNVQQELKSISPWRDHVQTGWQMFQPKYDIHLLTSTLYNYYLK